jgi:ubiquinone/menaquinone biosynthesis C-methylase UbiE
MLEKQRAQRVWGATPAGSAFAKGLDPGTKEFFESVSRRRNGYELRSVLKLIPFTAFTGSKVLEVGCGAGYDALEFCRAGAEYTGIDIAFENILRTKKHLALYGYWPKAVQGDAECLSFPDQAFDAVFSNGVLHHTPDMGQSFREIRRVLRRDGTFWVILYNRRSVFYGLTLYLFHHILKGGYRSCKFGERLAKIEYTTSGELPLVNAYTRREVASLLRQAGFTVGGAWVRKLNREDFPRVYPFLWRWIPQTVLDWIGSGFGWYIITKAIRTA